MLVWSVVEFFNYRLTDKLYSIGYFRQHRAAGFREPDIKTFLIVFNTLAATHKSSIRGLVFIDSNLSLKCPKVAQNIISYLN